MKYSFFNKRIFCIFLFYFSTISAQKITFINNTDKPITIENGNKEIIVKGHEKKELVDVTTRIKLKEIGRYVELFLEPTEKMVITLEKDKTLHYLGDRASVFEYINGNLNIDTFGKNDDYLKAIEKKNLGELTKYSELLLIDILKKIKQTNILFLENDTCAVKEMKSYIKYNWLLTILSCIQSQKNKNFAGQAVNYYFKKYSEADIPQYRCTSYYQYHAIETYAKYNDFLSIKLPTYPIIEHTDKDNVLQFLPKNCQKHYFTKKYDYLNHINSPEKEYYSKILNEKFND